MKRQTTRQQAWLLQGYATRHLQRFKPASIDFIWTDPPFNTGSKQKHLKGRSYEDDLSDAAYRAMLTDVLTQCHRVLKPTGNLFVLLDFRSVHDVKTWLDPIFGRDNFRGEIIWHSELGASRRFGKGWTVRHYTMLWYTRGDDYTFHFDRVPMVPRKAPKPGYEGPKPISSVWTYTMSNTHGQRVAYPSQKPLAIVEPLIAVHTDPGDVCLDPFAGSGTLMEASLRMGRRSVAIDSNPQAIEVIRERVRARFDGAVSLSIG